MNTNAYAWFFGSWVVLWPHAAEVETHRAGAVFYVATDNEIEEEEAPDGAGVSRTAGPGPGAARS